ncbi:MAG: sugar phosphate isomerase/epimerase family protein [Flavobacteriaceae bacterium]
MKKIIVLVFLVNAILACKNTPEETSETAQIITDTVPAKNYPLSLAQWSLNKPIFAGTADPMDFAKTAKEFGFEGLEYVSQLYTNEAVKFPMKEAGLQTILDSLKARSERYGMKNVLIMIDGEGDFSFNDEKITAQAVENHKKWVDAAAYLGCHSIRVNLFGEEDPEAWVKNSVRSLKALCDYAATKNVNIIVENHGGLSSNGALLARVMKEVNMPNCGTLPDFGNFCLKREGGARWGAPCVEEYDRYKGTAEILPFATGISAKSYAFDAQGNETTIDYYKMFNIIKNSDFDAFVGIEFEGPEEDPTEGIKATKALVEKAVAQSN